MEVSCRANPPALIMEARLLPMHARGRCVHAAAWCLLTRGTREVGALQHTAELLATHWSQRTGHNALVTTHHAYRTADNAQHALVAMHVPHTTRATQNPPTATRCARAQS